MRLYDCVRDQQLARALEQVRGDTGTYVAQKYNQNQQPIGDPLIFTEEAGHSITSAGSLGSAGEWVLIKVSDTAEAADAIRGNTSLTRSATR